MDKNDWKKLQDWWGVGFGSFDLEADGHKLQLTNYPNGKTMTIRVILYVDGWLKGAWLNITHPIGQKFYRVVKKPLYKSRFGSDVPQKYFTSVYPDWQSFAEFKRHLNSTCKQIKLIEND